MVALYIAALIYVHVHVASTLWGKIRECFNLRFVGVRVGFGLL